MRSLLMAALVMVACFVKVFSATAEPAKEDLFKTKPFTAAKSFTEHIGGVSCDADGNVYAVNFDRPGTIGKVTSDGKGEVWVELPGKGIGSGIVFDKKGRMYVADYVNHKILRFDVKTKKFDVFAHEPKMNLPNDLAIAPDGTIYASDPNYDNNTGRVWRIDTLGKVSLAAKDMGMTSGIEVSPDGKALYVSESSQRNVWKFRIEADGTLGGKRLLMNFPAYRLHGMRCDADGNLYIARGGSASVLILTSQGQVLKEVDMLSPVQVSLCFGGKDGRTVYVCEAENRRLVQFRSHKPGLAWQRWKE